MYNTLFEVDFWKRCWPLPVAAFLIILCIRFFGSDSDVISKVLSKDPLISISSKPDAELRGNCTVKVHFGPVAEKTAYSVQLMAPGIISPYQIAVNSVTVEGKGGDMEVTFSPANFKHTNFADFKVYAIVTRDGKPVCDNTNDPLNIRMR